MCLYNPLRVLPSAVSGKGRGVAKQQFQLGSSFGPVPFGRRLWMCRGGGCLCQGHHQTFVEALTRAQICPRSICTGLYWQGKGFWYEQSGKCPTTSHLNWKSRLRSTQNVCKSSEWEVISKESRTKPLLLTSGEHPRVQATCSLSVESGVCFSSYWAFVITNWEKKYFSLFLKWVKHQL